MATSTAKPTPATKEPHDVIPVSIGIDREDRKRLAGLLSQALADTAGNPEAPAMLESLVKDHQTVAAACAMRSRRPIG